MFNNLNELNIKANIEMHVENSLIEFRFTDYFKLDDIPDGVLISTLVNVENKLLIVDGFDYFIIIRRVSDNLIFKSIMTNENIKQIEELFFQCQDKDLYDVVINSKYTYDNLKNVRIRFLNYSKWEDKIEITLIHPQDLVSATVSRIKIANINKCINLKNLYSCDNIYTKEDLNNLCKL